MAAPSFPVIPPREDALVSSLIALMEQGTAPWRREWDGNHGGHHVNLLSGRAYRGANPILLTIGLHQRAASVPYWCGASEAKAHGLLPKKGSKAVTVLRPQVRQRRPVPQPPGHEDVQANDKTKAGGWVRYFPVSLFNAGDLEGETLQELIAARRSAEERFRRPEPERLGTAEAILQRWPVPIRHGGPKAFYNPQADHIQLPARSAFHSSAALYATWAHEALHSTGHSTRLNRDLSGVLGSTAYATEELVAELGAVLLGDRLEIGSNVGNHAAYLAEWIQLLRASPKLLYKLLSEARRAADLICPADTADGRRPPDGKGSHDQRQHPSSRGGEC